MLPEASLSARGPILEAGGAEVDSGEKPSRTDAAVGTRSHARFAEVGGGAGPEERKD